MILHTKYQGSRPSGFLCFLGSLVFLCFNYTTQCKTCDPPPPPPPGFEPFLSKLGSSRPCEFFVVYLNKPK